MGTGNHPCAARRRAREVRMGTPRGRSGGSRALASADMSRASSPEDAAQWWPERNIVAHRQGIEPCVVGFGGPARRQPVQCKRRRAPSAGCARGTTGRTRTLVSDVRSVVSHPRDGGKLYAVGQRPEYGSGRTPSRLGSAARISTSVASAPAGLAPPAVDTRRPPSRRCARRFADSVARVSLP